MKQFHTIGEKLKSLRKKEGHTLKDISVSTGLSLSYLSDIERGRADPSLKTLLKLSKAHDITVSALLCDLF